MATTVKVTETFDLKTTVNKVGIIGIHTPTGEQIRRLYPGLVKNHKFMRLLKCDVAGACASVLPADPLSVGVTSGQVAPEDMFNPILYKAVTNESFDALLSRIYDQTDVSTLGSVNEGQLNFSAADSFKAYYALLAEHGKFRKAMPQSGFSIRKLIPICHTLVSTYGNVGVIGNSTVLADDGETPVSVPDVTGVDVATNNLTSLAEAPKALVFRGKSVRMPKIPLHALAGGLEGYDAIPNVSIPKLFVAALIVPPAKLHEFYYRMRVTWTVRFEDLCTSLEAGGGNVYTGIGGYSYGTDYTIPSSKADLENSTGSVDTDGVDVNKIMES